MLRCIMNSAKILKCYSIKKKSKKTLQTQLYTNLLGISGTWIMRNEPELTKPRITITVSVYLDWLWTWLGRQERVGLSRERKSEDLAGWRKWSKEASPGSPGELPRMVYSE